MVTKITDYSTTAGSNTDVAGISLAEGWAPSTVNNLMRALIAQMAGAALLPVQRPVQIPRRIKIVTQRVEAVVGRGFLRLRRKRVGIRADIDPDAETPWFAGWTDQE